MSPQFATIIFIVGILGLFFLDRDKKAEASVALWIPVLWMWVACSRAFTQWVATIGGGAWSAQTTSPDQYLSGSPVDAAFFALLVAGGLLVLLWRRRQSWLFLRANIPILLFYFYCALAILWSDYPDVAAKRWIKFAGNLVMALVVLTDAEPKAAIKRLLARVTFLLIPLSILFVKYYPAWGRAYDPRPGVWTLMYTGVTTNKNEMGMICMILGLASLWRFFQGLRSDKGWERGRHLLAHGAILAMVFWLLWKVDSATSLSCFLMGGIIIVWGSFPRVFRRPAVLNTLALSMLSVAVFAVFSGNFLGALGRNSTLTGRTGLWSILLGMRGNSFFGTGFESYWLGQRVTVLWNMIWWHPTESHDGYLEIFLNLGLIGVAMLALVFFTGYRTIVAAFRRDADDGSFRLAYFVIVATYNLTEAAFVGISPVWLMFLMVTVATPIAVVAEARAPVPLDADRSVVPWNAARGYQLASKPVRKASIVPSRVSRRPA